jgi:hypothetical protein
MSQTTTSLKPIRLTESEWSEHRKLTSTLNQLDDFLRTTSWDGLFIYRSGVDASGNNDRELLELPLKREEVRAIIYDAKLRLQDAIKALEESGR